MEASYKLDGKVAIVTGASRGIGEVTARHMARDGAHAVFVSRTGARSTVEDLAGDGFSACSITCDVSEEAQVLAMVSDVVDRFGQVDILVNNAAINQTSKVEEITLESWNEILSTNLTGTFLCCKHVIPSMKQRAYGKIVNVSSIAGRFRSVMAGAHYVASKAGIIGLTRQIAYELAPSNINANVVCPSQTRTPMLEAVASSRDLERLSAQIPMRRLATPEEQANVILFLASDAASYLNGAVVDVNGGQW